MRQKLSTKLNLILLIAFCLLLTPYFLLPPSALAQEPGYDDVNRIAKQLNCPTCAGINLADCRTQTCQQWREQIADLLREGYSDQEVLDYFTTQYGPQVLQEPPRSGFTLILWVLPVLALLAGGTWLFYTLRSWSQQQSVSASDPAVLTPPPTVSAEPSSVSDDYLSQVEQDLGLDEGQAK